VRSFVGTEVRDQITEPVVDYLYLTLSEVLKYPLIRL